MLGAREAGPLGSFFPPTMPESQRLQKLRGHSQALLDAFLGLRLNYSLLEPLLGELDRPVPSRQADGLRSGIYALRMTLFHACVLDTAKLAWDSDTRTPSVANIVRTLRDEATAAALRETIEPVQVAYSSDDDEEHAAMIAAIEETEAGRRRDNFDSALARLFDRWQVFDGLSCKQELLSLRDRSIAHLEVRLEGDQYSPLDVASLQLRRKDLRVVIDEIAEMVIEITSLVRDSHFDMASAVTMFDLNATKFWTGLGLKAARE